MSSDISRTLDNKFYEICKQSNYGVLSTDSPDNNYFGYKLIKLNEIYSIIGVDNLLEIDILRRLNHPHIVNASILSPYNCNIEGLIIVLPLAERSLYNLIDDYTISTRSKLAILYKIVRAVEFLHSNNILHLNINESNVLLQDIRENHPLLNNFSFSMIVDDISRGKKDNNLFGEISHRAPEILTENITYNAAVDIWALGITMFSVLCGKHIFKDIDFSTISLINYKKYLEKTFSSDKVFNKMLINVEDKYNPLIKDLLIQILNIDHTKRPSAKEISNHQLFKEFSSSVIGGIINKVDIACNYSNDHRDILKLLIHWSKLLYSNYPCELLFLAIDLFHRTGSYYIKRSIEDKYTLVAACLYMAAKLTNNKIIPLHLFVEGIEKMAPKTTKEKILATELEIIHLLDGVLHVSRLYKICHNSDELYYSFYNVIMSKDYTLYAKLDIDQWKIILKDQCRIVNRKLKDLTIIELLG